MNAACLSIPFLGAGRLRLVLASDQDMQAILKVLLQCALDLLHSQLIASQIWHVSRHRHQPQSWAQLVSHLDLRWQSVNKGVYVCVVSEYPLCCGFKGKPKGKRQHFDFHFGLNKKSPIGHLFLVRGSSTATAICWATSTWCCAGLWPSTELWKKQAGAQDRLVGGSSCFVRAPRC